MHIVYGGLAGVKQYSTKYIYIYICAGPCRYDACTVQTYKYIYGALEGMKSIQYKYIYIYMVQRRAGGGVEVVVVVVGALASHV